MSISKDQSIGILESLGTLLVIYFNWVGFRNANINQDTSNLPLLLGLLNFASFFIVLLTAGRNYLPHLNPAVTLAFLAFGETRPAQAKQMFLSQLEAALVAVGLVLLGSLTSFTDQISGTVRIVASLLDDQSSPEHPDETFYFRRIFLGFLSAFLFGAFYAIGSKRFNEARLRFALMISTLVFAITAAFSGLTLGCLNPLFFLPFTIASLYFRADHLIFYLAVPIVGTFLGTYFGLVVMKDFNVQEKLQADVVVDLDLIKQKDLQFEY